MERLKATLSRKSDDVKQVDSQKRTKLGKQERGRCFECVCVRLLARATPARLPAPLHHPTQTRP